MVGTMAKKDDSVKKKVPELRFKGFTDDWEERKLGAITDCSYARFYGQIFFCPVYLISND